jgi:hypothetical protein
MIFPGMDPYLEAALVWPDVHSRLIVYMAELLQPYLRPRFVAAIQERVYIEGSGRTVVPDMWVRQVERPRPTASAAVLEADVPVEVYVPEMAVTETYLQILDLETNQQVVTVVELVSPSNKYAGPGREIYLAKQSEVRASPANLVEIDLLRAGPHVLAVPELVARSRGPYHYLVCGNRAEGKRDHFELYPCSLRARLPRVCIPLAEGAPDVVLDLQAAVQRTYEAGGFLDRLRYDKPVPSLSEEDRAWADGLIRAALSKP